MLAQKRDFCYSLLLSVGLAAVVFCQRPEYYWSIGNDSGRMNCENVFASGAQSDHTYGTHVSVIGFYVFFQTGRNQEESGLDEFVFQDRLGVYQELNATRREITSLKLLGMYGDYKKSGLSIAFERELIRDSVAKYYETAGSRDDCSIGFPAKSLVIHGIEPRELIKRDGSSVCIQVHDTTTYVPGIVRDVQILGFDYEPFNICALIKGCTQEGLSNITVIHNHDTFGVLRR